MRIAKIATALSILALSAGMASAAALSPDKTGIDDTTGLSAIGIDITTAGTSPAEIQQFIAGLPADTQRGVLGGCQTVATYPAGIAPNVVQFCENAVGAAPSNVLGFAPVEEPRMVPSPVLGPEPMSAY